MRYRYDLSLLLQIAKRDGAAVDEPQQPERLNRDSTILFTCSCGQTGCAKNFRCANIKGGMHCVDCQTKLMTMRVKESNLKMHGVDNPLKREQVRNKAKITNLARRGVEYASQDPEVQKKIMETNFKKRGVASALQCPRVKEKAKQTLLKKYNVDHCMKADFVKEKTKKLWVKKYGGHPLSSEDVQKKSKQTNQQKRGVDHSMQCPKVREKVKNKLLESRGVEHPLQDPSLMQKAIETSFRRKEVVKSTGEKIFLQGYEPQAWKILLTLHDEEDIIVKNAAKPQIWWTGNDGKKHRYFCDFFIPKERLVIEIKSKRTFFLAEQQNKNSRLREVITSMGFDYEIWVLNEKGAILEKH